MPANFGHIVQLTVEDVQGLRKAEKSYGDSWRIRGGVGAYMMLARKWDTTIKNDLSESGILDDIQDLRRYLLLVESHLLVENYAEALEKREDI